jgi:Uma2 family endonuclease
MKETERNQIEVEIMNTPPHEKIRMTPEEYRDFEKNSDTKHEYFDGEIFAMAGASPNHNRIQHNISGLLWSQRASRPCDTFLSDQRVKIEAAENYTYPDLSIACEEVEFDGDDCLVNPVIIIEILSKTSEAFDRGDKFTLYRMIPSLKEYILVSQYSSKVERFIRGEDGIWQILNPCTDMASSVKIESIDCELPLSDIYYRVEFETGPEPGRAV